MELIGYCAGVLSIITLFPQIIKLYKTKSSNDISMLMMVVWSLSVNLWLFYGIFLRSIPMIITNAGVLFLVIIILVLIIKYRKINFKKEKEK